MSDAEEKLRNLTEGLGPELADAIRSVFAEATGSRRELRYPVDTEDRLANIESRSRDPLEGVLDTSAPEASLGERPRRARRGRRRAQPVDSEFSPGMAFLRRLRESTRRNEQLQREGMQSYYEPEDFNRVELERAEEGGYSPAMSFAPPSLESMSSRPRPPTYTEGPMSSPANVYAGARNSPNPSPRLPTRRNVSPRSGMRY